jgi:small glutamine-rich tetratricopeptide repeat-containing protein alpha
METSGTDAPLSRAQVIFNFIEYLQDIKNEAKLDEDANESVDVATQCLSTAFGVDINNEEQKKKYSIKPQSFETVYGLGLQRKQKFEAALEQLQKKSGTEDNNNKDSLESKFSQYLQAVSKKGFFNGVNPGTPEYEQRFAKARQKFMEKYSTPSTANTSAVPVQEPQENLDGLTTDQKIELAEKHKLEGNTHLSNKNYPGAVQSYSKAIHANPDNAIYYANRAAAYSHMGQHEKAIEDCKVSIAKNSNYSKAYGRLGLAYFSLGRYEEAVEQYKKGLELEPNSVSIKESLAAAEQKLREKKGGSTSPRPQPAPGAGGMPNLANMLNDPNLLSSLGGLFGGAGAGAGAAQPQQAQQGAAPRQPGAGGLDFNSILSNPMFQTMAQQMMNNPAMMNMASNLMRNPEALNNMLGSLGIDPSQVQDEQNQENSDNVPQYL